VRIQDSEGSQRIFGARSLLYFAKYFAARECAPGPNTLTAALLPSSFRNKDFASFFSCSDTSARLIAVRTAVNDSSEILREQAGYNCG